MTVDDLPEGAREADRLGEQLLPEYRPSSILNHKMLEQAYTHTQKGCEPPDCNHARFWALVTKNTFFATMLLQEKIRDEAEHAITTQFEDVAGSLYAGLMTYLNTGLIDENDFARMQLFGEAFASWAAMRVPDVIRDAPDDASGDMIAKAMLWEGFQAGMMFTQLVEAAQGEQSDAGSN